MRVPLRYGVVALCLVSLACIQRSDPPPAVPQPSPNVAAPAPPPPAPPPADDPASCLDGSPETEEEKKLSRAKTEEYDTASAELQRLVAERSDELRSCGIATVSAAEIDLEVEVPADGVTRARVLGTSITECAAIGCVREKIAGLKLPPPKIYEKHTFRWRLAVENRGPVRFEPANPSATWFGKSPESSAACLDQQQPSPTGRGLLPPEVIRRIVRDNYEVLRKCYQSGLARNPNLEGKIRVRFIIATDGSVSNSSLDGNELADCAVAHCIRDAFRTLQFPAPEGGIVTVQYPIFFQPG